MPSFGQQVSACGLKRQFPRRFYCRRTGCSAWPRLHLALCQFFGAWVTLSSGAGFQAEQILLMLFLESRSQRQLRKKMT